MGCVLILCVHLVLLPRRKVWSFCVTTTPTSKTFFLLADRKFKTFNYKCSLFSLYGLLKDSIWCHFVSISSFFSSLRCWNRFSFVKNDDLGWLRSEHAILLVSVLFPFSLLMCIFLIALSPSFSLSFSRLTLLPNVGKGKLFKDVSFSSCHRHNTQNRTYPITNDDRLWWCPWKGALHSYISLLHTCDSFFQLFLPFVSFRWLFFLVLFFHYSFSNYSFSYFSFSTFLPLPSCAYHFLLDVRSLPSLPKRIRFPVWGSFTSLKFPFRLICHSFLFSSYHWFSVQKSIIFAITWKTRKGESVSRRERMRFIVLLSTCFSMHESSAVLHH